MSSNPALVDKEAPVGAEGVERFESIPALLRFRAQAQPGVAAIWAPGLKPLTFDALDLGKSAVIDGLAVVLDAATLQRPVRRLPQLSRPAPMLALRLVRSPNPSRSAH